MLYLRRFGTMVGRPQNDACSRGAIPPANPGQDRALAPNYEEPCAAGKLLPPRRPRTPNRGLRRVLQQPTLPREPEQRHTRRRLLRPRQSNSEGKSEDQGTDNPPTALATSKTSGIINYTNEPEPPKLKPL